MKNIGSIVSIDGMPESAYVELLDGRSRIKILEWYDGDILNQSAERLTNAINVLRWCFNEAVDFDLYDKQVRDKMLRSASIRFGLEPSKIFNLLASSSRLNTSSGNGCRIIAVEGIDGSGKTTQIELIKQRLENMNYKVLLMSFPEYQGFFGKEIGHLLSGKGEVDAITIDPKSMSLWYAVDRKVQLEKVKLSDYDIVLFNRFTLSSAVYQSIRVEEQFEDDIVKWVFLLEHKEFKLPVPDIYLVLDVDQRCSSDNVLNKGHRDYIGRDADVYEKSSELINNAREKYMKMAEVVDNIKIIDCTDGHGKMLGVNETNAILLEAIIEHVL